MSKYNFRIDCIDTNTAYGKILIRINPGSTVLECGCATGYMTRYMHEEMKCTVDIVEVDPEACRTAMQWARNFVCGSLEDIWWRMKLDCNKYDYVLFADVLEHLREPLKAVKHAAEFLKTGGKMIVSIPNICHNDVILNMIEGKFTYTKHGLLDDTHVHFWGRGDFERFCTEAGLRIMDADKVIIPTGQTEQHPNVKRAGPTAMNVLKARHDGEVYQWIFVMER